jgi:hypothetical protein
MRVDGHDPGNAACRRVAIGFHAHPFPFWSKGSFATFPWINRRIVGLTAGGTFLYVRR